MVRPTAPIRSALPVVLIAALVPVMAAAAEPAAPPASRALGAAASELRAIDAAAPVTADGFEERDGLRERAVRVARAAATSVTELQDELTALEAQTSLLGPVPTRTMEAADIRARRRALTSRHGVLDSAIKRGKLLTIAARQLAARIDHRDAEAFNAALSTRTGSPLLPSFWQPVLHELPRDLARLRRFMANQADATWRGIRSGHGWRAALGLLAALALMIPGRMTLQAAGRRLMIDHAPGSRLRRSGLALWLATLGTLVPLVAATALVEGFRAAGMIGTRWEALSSIFLRAVAMTGLINALGGALLQRGRPSWRLPPIGEETAHTLRAWTMIAAGTAFASIMFAAVKQEAGASAAGSGAGDVAIIACHLALAFCILLAIGRIRIAAARASIDDQQDDRGLAGVALISLLPWLAAIAASGALLLGYVPLALLASGMLLWVPVVAAGLYLLLVAVDDLCSELISGNGFLGRMLHDAFGLRRSLVDQIGVALSAILRVLLAATAVAIAFAPFGSNFGRLIDHVVELSHGVTVGEITIAPGAILRSLLVLAAGLFAMRIVRAWLNNRYLPITDLDIGARNSISTVTGYVGIILSALWALAALGIGFERIALILSALSVGIGFGLQAITQNFVSGLILLIERPVKIGDLIRVGDQEGDVKRISVRATEIVTGDKSTVIVPNSDMITKPIRNLTLADPIGRVQIRFAVPLDTAIDTVRDTMMALFEGEPAVLAEPAPKVSLDSLDDGAAHFNCIAYVGSPRQSYDTRSELLFALIAALDAAGIDIHSPEKDRRPELAASDAPGGNDDQARRQEPARGTRT